MATETHHGGTVTRSEKEDSQLKRDAQKYREGAEMVKKGQVRAGLAHGIGGTYGELITAALGGAGIYALAQSDWFSKMEIFKKNWWIRALVVAIGGYLLWRGGFKGWGTAVFASAAAILVQDWKEHQARTSTDAKGPGDEAGEAGWWGSPRWNWEERRRERFLEGDRIARERAARMFERERELAAA